uniref:C-type mannose receptor 2-like n=1 Tax=Centroberyx gerrardi TaxID=166262 RepID=UPI003AAAD5AF
MAACFLVTNGFIPSSHLLHEYHSINLKMNWTDAQRYCRVKHADLATVENTEDTSRLNRFEFGDASMAWIGLTDDPKSWKQIMGKDENSWRWSASGETSRTSYLNWNPIQPNNKYGNQNCVYLYRDGTWNDDDYTNPRKKIYIFIQNPLSWTEAQAYCRAHHTDLAVIESAQESGEAVSKKTTDYAWIGLHRAPWKWSDDSSSSFTHWKQGQPNNLGLNQYCAAVFLRDGLWADMNCNSKLPFFCHGALNVKKTVVKMKIQTDADMTDPATNAQILQQLHAALRNQGATDFQLYWKTEPVKQDE